MNAKERAAVKAVDLVQHEMILGLGTGSTAVLLVREIGRRMRQGLLQNVRGVPTSEAIAQVAREEGIPLLPLEETTLCDLTLDGADEVDPSWNLVKGGGSAALLCARRLLRRRRERKRSWSMIPNWSNGWAIACRCRWR